MRRAIGTRHWENVPTARGGAVPAPTINTARSESSHSEVTEGSALLGGSVNATLDNAEYKDTVLFLAQQQQMQHHEMMDMLQGVMTLILSNNKNSNGNNNTTGDVTDNNNYSKNAFSASSHRDSNTQHQTPLNKQSTVEYNIGKLSASASATTTTQTAAARNVQNKDSVVGIPGSYAATQSQWYRQANSSDVDSQAMATRIQQMEQHIKLLEAQIASKDNTIRQLTESNITNMALISQRTIAGTQQQLEAFASPYQQTTSVNRGGADANGGASSYTTGSTAELTSGSRLAKLHQDVSEQLSNEITSAAAYHNSRPLTVVGSGNAGGTFSSSVGGSNAIGGNPALRQLLERHQQRCQQLLA